MESKRNTRSDTRPDTICLEEVIHNFKADGAIGCGIAFAIVGDHENRPTDMTNLVVYERNKNGEQYEI